jgi:hypothetical protein
MDPAFHTQTQIRSQLPRLVRIQSGHNYLVAYHRVPGTYVDVSPDVVRLHECCLLEEKEGIVVHPLGLQGVPHIVVQLRVLHTHTYTPLSSIRVY